MSTKLKRAWYNGTQVAYAVYDDGKIVFSGIHNPKQGVTGDTIFYAEAFIIEISRIEKINPLNYLFYDLRTSTGYPHYDFGEYTYDLLSIIWDKVRIISVDWIGVNCPENVISDFASYITGGRMLEVRNRRGVSRITYDTYINFIFFAEQRLGKKGDPTLANEFKHRCLRVGAAICDENGIDRLNVGESLVNLSRLTPLQDRSKNALADVIVWVGSKDQYLKRYAHSTSLVE